ncbi:MAG TPA: hypothetical protein VN524_01410, partial [Hyphomicrobiaceae bacterium]|nr:hypothetical protein [Hyphomicrobiaceae bacterium]
PCYLLCPRLTTTEDTEEVQATDFLDTAQELLRSSRGAPRQANLRKACSAVYYALFHTICATCAGTLTVRGTRRAWTQVYRAVDHGTASKKCKKLEEMGFPAEIVDFADLFVQMQEKRHRADYDPHERLYKSAVETDIKAATAIIAAFRKSPLRHRRAFAAFMVVKTRDT